MSYFFQTAIFFQVFRIFRPFHRRQDRNMQPIVTVLASPGPVLQYLRISDQLTNGTDI